MSTRAIPADTLIQVWDADETIHAAAVGPGVLCQASEPDRAAPAVLTVAWEPGADKVTCWPCKQAMRQLEVTGRLR